MAQKEKFTPRPYQIEILEQALKGNTIIYLPTGSGKTYIAIMMIDKLSADIKKPWNEGGKRTVFLVNTVPLVQQQCSYIREHLDLACEGYSGNMNANVWDINMWTKEFIKNQVLVMTSQMLLIILNHGFLPLSRINLIIFDECHHAIHDHPMRLIMKRYEDCSPELQPKVLGMSATLLNSNVESFEVPDNVRNLEITFHAKVITLNAMNQVQCYGKLIETVCYYDLPHSALHIELDSYVDHAITILKSVELDQSNAHLKSSKVFQPKSKNSKIICILESIRENYKTQGLYFTFQALFNHITQLHKIKESINDMQSIIVMDCLITKLTIMRKIIADTMGNVSELKKMTMHSCNQLDKLFNILHEFRSYNCINEETKFCCLIFVRRRFNATILCQILRDRARIDSQFQFLVPEYVVGNSDNPYKNLKESISIRRKNAETLTNFREGNINCLISTDVLDEGIDIPLCSLIIAYDVPNNFRAYIQSKGRGRHKDSHYIIFSEKHEKFMKKYRKFHEVEDYLSQLLVGHCDQRLEPSIEEFQKHLYIKEIDPLFVTNRAGTQSVITETSAVSIIYQYCARISRSVVDNCVPIWTLERNKEGIKKNTEYFLVKLDLPKASPLEAPIYSDLMTSIVSAKRSAAMKACKKLYEIGELSDSLLPNKDHYMQNHI